MGAERLAAPVKCAFFLRKKRGRTNMTSLQDFEKATGNVLVALIILFNDLWCLIDSEIFIKTI